MYCEPVTGSALSRPGEPTEAAPGSEEKVRIMIERAARRESLFHPLDGLTPRDVPQASPSQPAWWKVDPVSADSEADLFEPRIEEIETGGDDAAEPPQILPLRDYVERAHTA